MRRINIYSIFYVQFSFIDLRVDNTCLAIGIWVANINCRIRTSRIFIMTGTMDCA
jgi:hypothetical protein